MKWLQITLLVLLLPCLASSQQTIEASITHGGISRSYILYVPASYDAGTPAPLVLNFHGYTSNNLEQMFYGDFRPIADTAGFLVVHPMGTTDFLGNPHWNVGWGASTVDDVGFTSALIDSLSADYTIDPERVYSTGMSNGGFFSYKLACELSDRIAAIASVTGSMNVNQSATCNPSHPMPVMEIHGTADDVVAYEGNFIFASTPSVVSFWVGKNNCSPTAALTAIEDTDMADGCTAERYLYADGDNGTTVEHYKIINGAHTWPGSFFGGVGTNQDMDASKEIWRFFSQYDIHGRIESVSTKQDANKPWAHVYPNPAGDYINLISAHASPVPFVISNYMGQTVASGMITSSEQTLDISTLASGMYILSTSEERIRFLKINH